MRPTRYPPRRNRRRRREPQHYHGTTATSAGAASRNAGRPDHGTIYTGEIRTAGTMLYQAGSVIDSLFGSGTVTFATTFSQTEPGVIHLVTKTARLFTPTGVLTGTISADIHVISATQSVVTHGKMTLRGISAGQRHHRLIGTFAGTGNPMTTHYTFGYSATYR